PKGWRNRNGVAPSFGRDCAAGFARRADIDRQRIAADRNFPSELACPLPMNRFLRPLFLVAAAMTFPAAAQTPPTTSPAQAWPANRPPAPPPQAQPAPPAQPAGQPQAQQQQTPAPPQAPALNPNAPVPLPSWFSEIDTAKKGEVSRADFLKYRMKTFDQLDTNKDGKLSLEEFLKVAEPPFTADGPNVPSVEDRRTRARQDFQNLDNNRDGL